MIQAIPTVIIPMQVAPTAQTTIYTSPIGTTTIVDTMTVCNTTAGNLTLSLNLVPSGQSVSTNNLLLKTFTFSGGQSAQVIALESTAVLAQQIFAPGDFISAIASGPGLNIVGGGRQCS